MAQYERQEEERKAKARGSKSAPPAPAQSNPWGAPTRAGANADTWGADDASECGLARTVNACLAADCLVSFGLTRSRRALRVTVLKGSHKGVMYLNAGEPDGNTAECEAAYLWAVGLPEYRADTDAALSGEQAGG